MFCLGTERLVLAGYRGISSDDNKAMRMVLSLMQYHAEGIPCLSRIVTEDESGTLLHWDKETINVMETPLDSFPHNKVKIMPSVKKVMATIFWDHQVVLLVDFLNREATREENSRPSKSKIENLFSKVTSDCDGKTSYSAFWICRKRQFDGNDRDYYPEA